MKSRAKRALLCFFVLIAGAVTFSCATNDDSGTHATNAILRGMVYSLNRMPVLDVKVSLLSDGKSTASTQTDIHGRYFFPNVPYGRVGLLFTKNGYEPLEWSFSFDKPTQVVYVQVVSLNELLDRAEDSIAKRNWAEATAYLGRVRKIEPDNTVATYLEAEMLSRQGDPQRAAALLETLSSDRDPSLAVELALADLYQFKLGQNEKALQHLEKALMIQDDVDVENRVDALKKNSEQ